MDAHFPARFQTRFETFWFQQSLHISGKSRHRVSHNRLPSRERRPGTGNLFDSTADCQVRDRSERPEDHSTDFAVTCKGARSTSVELYARYSGVPCEGAALEELEDGTASAWRASALGVQACGLKCAQSALCSAFEWEGEEDDPKGRCSWFQGDVTLGAVRASAHRSCHLPKPVPRIDTAHAPLFVRTKMAWSDAQTSFGFGAAAEICVEESKQACDAAAGDTGGWVSQSLDNVSGRFDSGKLDDDCNRAWVADYDGDGPLCDTRGVPQLDGTRCFSTGPAAL